MKNQQVSPLALLTSIIGNKKRDMALSVSGDHLEIVGKHSRKAHHVIEDIGIMINGLDVVEEEYSTRITDKEEVVTVTLPFEPKPGDVIVVDTDINHLGSRTITLKVE
jgi:hypothetical protein